MIIDDVMAIKKMDIRNVYTVKKSQKDWLRPPRAPDVEPAPNFPNTWSIYRRATQRDQCGRISYSRRARGENRRNGSPPFWFYGKSIRNRDGECTQAWHLRRREPNTFVPPVQSG